MISKAFVAPACPEFSKGILPAIFRPLPQTEIAGRVAQ
jgi:hypothetical protein